METTSDNKIKEGSAKKLEPPSSQPEPKHLYIYLPLRHMLIIIKQILSEICPMKFFPFSFCSKLLILRQVMFLKVQFSLSRNYLDQAPILKDLKDFRIKWKVLAVTAKGQQNKFVMLQYLKTLELTQNSLLLMLILYNLVFAGGPDHRNGSCGKLLEVFVISSRAHP